ncbi:MAG: hypothetical protein JETCAE03_33730 [Ignavibacteriaceae bacterium]|jgi:hypothetical protein|nr:MAG: hypothetical protein JETCAE03_33730 [Ignavibacteriaceae bacterium]
MNKLQENKLREMIRQMISELEEDLIPRKEESPYQKFFKSALKKYGVNSPEELSPKKKEEFFNYVDSNWDAGENETDIDETTNSSAAGEYMIPGAFTRKDQDHTKSPASKAIGWKVAKRIDEGKTIPLDINKIEVGDKIIDINDEKFKVLNIDKKGIIVKDLQSPNDHISLTWQQVKKDGKYIMKEVKDKYSVYNKKTFDIVRTNLTKDAAVKFATKNKDYAYGSAAWVEDQYREKHKNEIVEGRKPKKPIEKFFAVVENMDEGTLKNKLFAPLKVDYIDTPGFWYDDEERKGYIDINEFMKVNMGSDDYNKLVSLYNNNQKFCDAFTKKYGKDYMFESIDFKDENFTPRQKMAQAVRGMREQLKEVEKLVDKASIFKEENGMKSAEMYKRTHGALRKINEITIRIMNKLNKIK